MRWRRCDAGEVCVSDGCFGALRGGRVGRIQLVAGLLLVCVVGFTGTALAATEPCPNAKLRVGPSATLPDCRAYELVTPANLGRTQAMTFTEFDTDHAIPSSDGEGVALETLVPLEPNPSASATAKGTDAVFSRTPTGWTMQSAVAPGSSPADRLEMDLFSPNLSQVALESYTYLNYKEYSENTLLEVGPVGGPYALVATVPNNGTTKFLGANAGAGGVAALSHVLLASADHELLPPGTERTLVEETVAGAPDLYDWTGRHLQLVNVEGEGSQIELVNRCGARLGEGGGDSAGAAAADAVSDDGSKVFFTTLHSGATCREPGRLYMRVDGRETVEVSAPEPGFTPPEILPVHYDGATPDGLEVFFNTETALTAGARVEPHTSKLYEYNTEAPQGERLKLIASGFPEEDNEGPGRYVVISEDGSTVYYESGGSSVFDIYRYDTRTGTTSFVATAKAPKDLFEPSFTTPNGEFLVFAAWGTSGILEEEGVAGEPRGTGHNELYRYDAADGSVMCVSCGEGNAPAEGEMSEPKANSPLETADETPPFIPMSENGQEVFFQTTAKLVPQDTNTVVDVYEWEADGSEEAPGAFCRETNGCTHLLSSGEDVGPAVFLGASRDGSNVFFSTAAQLAPQATPEFTSIYDARVYGGFAPPAPAPECSSCQGVGSPLPLFSPGASLTFAGAGNPAAHSPSTAPSKATTTKKSKCPKGKKRSHSKCVKTRSKHKAEAKKAGSNRREKS